VENAHSAKLEKYIQAITGFKGAYPQDGRLKDLWATVSTAFNKSRGPLNQENTSSAVEKRRGAAEALTKLAPISDALSSKTVSKTDVEEDVKKIANAIKPLDVNGVLTCIEGILNANRKDTDQKMYVFDAKKKK